MRYTVPQFLDVEDKVLGPITPRQFVILMVTALFLFILYKLATFTYFLAFGIPLLIMAAVLAFMRVNGMPFHFFLLNIIQTTRRPKLRVWDKTLTDAEIKAIIKTPPPPPPKAKIKKAPLAATKLAELTLVVNTGGVYNPED